mgnify:CR=1 FL=1
MNNKLSFNYLIGIIKRKNIIFIFIFILIFIIIYSDFNFLINSKQEFRNVILIGWAGAQREHVHELLNELELSNLQKIIDEGNIVNITVTTGETKTMGGWAEVLTGYNPKITKVFSEIDYKPIPRGYTIFERLENYFGKEDIITVFIGGKPAGIGANGPYKICVNCLRRDLSGKRTDWWNENTSALTKDGSERIFLETEGEPYNFTAESIDVHLVGLGNGSNVVDKARGYLEKYKDERFFMFAQFQEPDERGHKYGENSEEYGNALIFNDYWLGMILSKLKELEIYDETLVYVVSEHGFNDGMYHHNDAPYAFLATNDKTVKNNGDRKDITPTILWQYGLDLNKISPQLDGIPLN